MGGSQHRARTEDEPSTRETSQSEDATAWDAAMDKEVRALKELSFWSVVERPTDQKLRARAEEEN